MDRRDLAKRFPHLMGGLPEADAEALIAALTARSLVPGEVLIEDGKPSSVAYLVFEGALGVMVGVGRERLAVGRVEAGDMVGEVSFVDGGPASATLTAQTPVTVLEVTPAILDELLHEHPAAAAAVQRQICEALAGHLRLATDELMELETGAPHEDHHGEGLLSALRSLLGLRK